MLILGCIGYMLVNECVNKPSNLLYTHQKRLAVIRPKNYSTTRATTAVSRAKAIYDNGGDYFLIYPLDFLNLTNDTRDNVFGNPYCSKVVYLAWRAAGIELNADNIHGNVVAPDELYNSAFNRGYTVTIKLLGITIASWYTQTYTATSNVIRNMNR